MILAQGASNVPAEPLRSYPIDVVVLGSTGSIGTQALEVIRDHPGHFRVVALSAAGSRPSEFAQQILQFRPRVAGLTGSPLQPQGIGGKEAVPEIISDAANRIGTDLVVDPQASTDLAGMFPGATILNGINGGIGLEPTLAALRAGCILALANKESLVVGGSVVKRAVQYPAQVVPVDSEHSAIAQALLTGHHEKGLVSRTVTGQSDLLSLVLTASGGPFRGLKRNELACVTAKQALAHPTWEMGPVVTVNSSTLMNKGLELIEASLLFDVPPAQITPVIHPQSIVHSMVTWRDGSTITQASYPDMKVPISLGMDWNRHLDDVGVPMKWDQATSWTFEPVDHQTFPALKLAQQCLEASGTHTAVLNAANEVCVAAFLAGALDWLQILDIVTQVVEEHDGIANPDLADVLGVQEQAFARARELVSGSSSTTGSGPAGVDR